MGTNQMETLNSADKSQQKDIAKRANTTPRAWTSFASQRHKDSSQQFEAQIRHRFSTSSQLSNTHFEQTRQLLCGASVNFEDLAETGHGTVVVPIRLRRLWVARVLITRQWQPIAGFRGPQGSKVGGRVFWLSWSRDASRNLITRKQEGG